MRLTVGPLPPAVYWRRRALVLGAALLVLFLIAQACMAAAPAGNQAGSDESTPSPSALGSVAPTSPPPAPTSPSESSAPAGEDEQVDREGAGGAELGPEYCTDAEIRVIAEASQTRFAVGEQVQFTIRIAHVADRPCRRDVGGDLRELYLVPASGAGHVWSSQDCANPTGSEEVELTSGSLERTHHIGFSGRSTSSCDGPEADGPELEPGEYQLRARLGTARSEPVTITLT